MKYVHSVLLLALLAGLAACRKDRLHWQSATRLASGTEGRLNRILVTRDGGLVVVGGDRFDYSVILTSGDGGSSWLPQISSNGGKALYGCTEDERGFLYAIGFDSRFLFSQDGGRQWTFRQVDTWAPHKAIAAAGPGRLIAVGGISYENGLCTFLTDSGSLRRNEQLPYELNDIRMLSADYGYIAGTGAVLRTTDSGNSWSWQPVTDDNFKAISVLDRLTIFVCGYNGSIWKTADGGARWQRLRNGNDITLPRYRLYDLVFTDADHGYAVGEQGAVIYTEDGGRHWLEYDRFTSRHLYGIEKLPRGGLLVCGEGGELWKLEP